MGEELVVSFAWRISHPFYFGNKPIIVLSRKPGMHKPSDILSEDDVKQMEKERIDNIYFLTQMSHNSLAVVAENSGHEIHLEQPELVVKAIRSVVEACRKKSKIVPFKN